MQFIYSSEQLIVTVQTKNSESALLRVSNDVLLINTDSGDSAIFVLSDLTAASFMYSTVWLLETLAWSG